MPQKFLRDGKWLTIEQVRALKKPKKEIKKPSKKEDKE